MSENQAGGVDGPVFPKTRKLKAQEGQWSFTIGDTTYTGTTGVNNMAALEEKDYRGILAGVLVAGTLALAAVSMLTDKPVPAWEAFLTLTGMAVAWYFKK